MTGDSKRGVAKLINALSSKLPSETVPKGTFKYPSSFERFVLKAAGDLDSA